LELEPFIFETRARERVHGNFVVGNNEMWHLQHLKATRNQRTARAIGVPVKLTMTSEDVIHDFTFRRFASRRM